MADNTSEEPLDNLPNSQPENSADQIYAAENTNTIKPKTTNQNMDVHKHPHHPTHKKKWNEYLLEFFMLFLAVFLGFIAENVREHSVEKERAKQLSFSLVADLKKDSAQLSDLREFRNKRLLKIDSFYRMLQQDPANVDRKSFYACAKAIQSTFDFTPATGTVNELKSASYLNYFINTKLAMLLAEKEIINSDCSMDENIEHNLVYDDYYSILRKATDAASFDSLFNYPNAIHGTGIVPIQKENLANCKKIITQIKYVSSVFIRQEGQYDKLHKKGKEIIDYMNEKYTN